MSVGLIGARVGWLMSGCGCLIGVFGSAVVDIALVYHDDRTEEAANHFKRFKTCLFMYFCK